MGSTSLDSTDGGLKIFFFFNSEKFQKELNLSHAKNYLHNINVILGITSNLEMI